MNYEAYILMSAAVWRIIATIREPILKPFHDKLLGWTPRYYERVYTTVIWLLAFIVGYAYATMAGQQGGDMLYALEWTDGYAEIGYAMTAGLIACGSAGMRVVEKLFDEKKS
jgi:hypothetical protein